MISDNEYKAAKAWKDSHDPVKKLEEENNALHKAIDELSLSLSSTENANEVIQIMLENSQEENKTLKSIINKIMTGIDLPFTREECEIVYNKKTSPDNNKENKP